MSSCTNFQLVLLVFGDIFDDVDDVEEKYESQELHETSFQNEKVSLVGWIGELPHHDMRPVENYIRVQCFHDSKIDALLQREEASCDVVCNSSEKNGNSN